MNREDLQELIDSTSNTNTAGNDILVPGGGLTAVELKLLLNNLNNGYINILTEINDSMLNSIDDPAANMAYNDLIISADRNHDMFSHSWSMVNGQQFKFSNAYNPPIGEGNFEFEGSADDNQLVYRILNDGNLLSQLFGDGRLKHFGTVGVNADPTPGYAIYSKDSITGLRGDGYYGLMGITDAAGGYGGYFSDAGIGSGALRSDGNMLLNGTLSIGSNSRYIRKNPDSQAIQISCTTSSGDVGATIGFGHNGPELFFSGDWGSGPTVQMQSSSSWVYQTLNGGTHGYSVGMMDGDWKLKGYIGIDPSVPTDIHSVNWIDGLANWHYDLNLAHVDTPNDNVIHFNKSNLLGQRIESGFDGDYFVQMVGYDYAAMKTETGLAELTIAEDTNAFRGNLITLTENINYDQNLFSVGYDGTAYNVLELNHKGVVNNVVKIGQGELEMDLFPDITTSTFLMFGSKVSGNTVPAFMTENEDIIKLYKQDLPTAPTTAQIATLLSNLGFANLV